jgi:hypothetical protein
MAGAACACCADRGGELPDSLILLRNFLRQTRGEAVAAAMIHLRLMAAALWPPRHVDDRGRRRYFTAKPSKGSYSYRQ